MTLYHNQCYKCFCSTYYEEVDDGRDDFVGGACDDCGCSTQGDAYDDDDD